MTRLTVHLTLFGLDGPGDDFTNKKNPSQGEVFILGSVTSKEVLERLNSCITVKRCN